MPSTSAKHTHTNSDARERRNTGSAPCASTSTFSYDGVVPNSGHVLDGQGLGLGMSLDALDTTHGDLFWPSLSDYPPLEFDDDLFSNMETGPFTLPTPVSESFTTPTKQPDTSHSKIDESKYPDNASLQPPSNGGHDCFREAYDILGSLSLHRFHNTHSISEAPPTPSSALTTASTANRVPLDHVLRLNREASERLGHLLTCSCAGFPQLTILHASIISQILTWYQQAAGCTQTASCTKPASLWHNPTDTRSDVCPTSLTDSSPSSASGSGAGPSPWSSTAASTLSTGGGRNTPTLPHFPAPVAPAKMAIGTFDIDDTRVQTALKIQLLSGEMRRAGRLIEQFSLRNADGQCTTGEHARFGGVHGLYRSLDAWLRGEHTRIAGMMKEKLRELNS
ncbi:MAG: hypothetical protein Q9188_002563 [Gyalolechia gomerana]